MPGDARKNPDLLLAAIQKEEVERHRGSLKVFLGMCPGVGKTYAMLEAAQRELKAGRDVVIGYIETHGRKETDTLAQGLAVVPRRSVEYRGVTFTETDLDAVLARKPSLVLMDELAHSNAPGSRHPKRYQDVLELLDAGMDVFTTLNVQHVESRAEAVRQITGVTVRETVPDTALADAELELVDLPPDELRARLVAGQVYLAERAVAAHDSFFRSGNLSALRELALRLVADQVGQDVRDYRLTHGILDPWKSGQRLLVAVSASPTSASLIRWACRLAGELKAPWVAAYVEHPRPLSEEEQKRLDTHLALAGTLGAQVVTTSDRDLVSGIIRVAREQNVTQLVVGKPAGWRVVELFLGGSFLNRLIQASGNIDVHAVRAEAGAAPPRPARTPGFEWWPWRSLFLALAGIAGVTCVSLLLQRWTGYQAIALVYLLAVVLLGLMVRRSAVFVASVLSALLWNFLFVPPTFTFHISNAHDWMLFLLLMIVGLVIGQLTARLRAQQLAERGREQRSTALYLLTRQLAESTELAQLLGVVVRHVGETLDGEVALSLPDDESDAPLTPYFAGTWPLSEKELSVAVWAFQHHQAAGHGTATLTSSEGLHLPLISGERAVGVLSLRFRRAAPLPPAQRELLDAFTRQIALVLDRQRLRDAEIGEQLLAESERLGKTLLNSVSHEIRTPIAAITSAASSLAGLANAGRSEFERTMVGEIQEAAGRLNRLVGNLLDITRLETGHIKPKLDWCDVNDLVHMAAHDTADELAGYPIAVSAAPGLPLVRMDFVLMQQALMNLLLNAAVHTPPGTAVEVSASVEKDNLLLTVADRGPGLPPDAMERVFDKFYRAQTAPAGGTGLGLSIVKGFVEAQGGQVTAANRPGGGAAFAIRLPMKETPPMSAETLP